MTAAMQLKDTWLLGRKAMTNIDNILKSKRHHFADKPYTQIIYDKPYAQNYGFSGSNVWV